VSTNSLITEKANGVGAAGCVFFRKHHDNITLRNPEITREQVKHAAELCGVAEWIERLPDNYDFSVMERGATLSVGQRQLISFVRALVFNPKILILDEATSSIDTESETLIQNAIEKLIEGRTSIIIAHRSFHHSAC
jgi:ATP-binding cassette subfamily B protein